MFQPLSNYVLIEPIEIPDTTPSGLVLPESSKEKPNQGRVVAVGSGQTTDHGDTIPIMVFKEDIVFFNKYSGIEIKLDGKKYLLMRDVELLGYSR